MEVIYSYCKKKYQMPGGQVQGLLHSKCCWVKMTRNWVRWELALSQPTPSGPSSRVIRVILTQKNWECGIFALTLPNLTINGGSPDQVPAIPRGGVGYNSALSTYILYVSKEQIIGLFLDNEYIWLLSYLLSASYSTCGEFEGENDGLCVTF